MGASNIPSNIINSRIPPKSFLEHFTPGSRLRLKDNVHKHIKDREWILNKIEGNEVHLLHESKLYGLIVKIEDINWDDSSALNMRNKEEVKKNYAQERKS